MVSITLDMKNRFLRFIVIPIEGLHGLRITFLPDSEFWHQTVGNGVDGAVGDVHPVQIQYMFANVLVAVV